MSERSLLVVLAHPDDESFPMGGTLAKYAAEGVPVTLVSATRGQAGIPGLAPEAAARVREKELLAAADALGVGDVRFLGYRDGALAQADPEPLIAKLVRIMQELQPQAVITFGPDGISGHPDHVAIHRLTTLAFDRAGGAARLYYIAPSEATRQGCGVAPARGPADTSAAIIDVGEHLVAKARAMHCHASQNPPLDEGSPEEGAKHLVCRERFTLARPALREIVLTDLFGPLGEP